MLDGIDKYGRPLTRIRLSNGHDAGLEMIHSRDALATRPAPISCKVTELRARKASRGLWKKRGGIHSPAAWRQANS